jgi:hypothetical protein
LKVEESKLTRIQKSARMVTIATVLFAVVMCGVAYWQVHAKGGFLWLRGGAARRERNKGVALEEYRRY